MSTELRRHTAWRALLRVFRPDTPGFWRRAGAIPRMVGATLTGRYDGGGRLAMMLVSGLYIVSPIDLVPEGILMVIGLVDDAAVAAWFAGALLDETERFLAWEKARETVIPGEYAYRKHA